MGDVLLSRQRSTPLIPGLLTRRFWLLAALVLAPVLAIAQPAPAPLYETRAVWLTTVWRLDWPSSVNNAAAQEQQLREIIRNAKRLGLNTVVFQIMSHGEAMYPSERLPWANWLTGTPGRHPGFDPLAVAIDEAHRQGLELHGWFNVFHIAAATSNISATAEPVHVRFAHPEWIVQHSDNSYWGNPGVEAFRDWQIGNVMEVVRNYDIDAVHFDYMRYPAREGLAGDADRYQASPNGAPSLAQWRRNNVNQFVRDVYEQVKAEKPWVKVGSAPIGAYKYFSGAPPGFWGYDDVYQEAHAWLAEGNMDYVAPQLYFTIGTAPLAPATYASQDFERWVKDWMANRNSRHVYIGQGTYLETAERRFPNGEIANQVGMVRREGAAGQVQFRYAHTTGAPFAGQYTRPSLPPPMPWIWNAAAPEAPEVSLSYNPNTRTVRLHWAPVAGGSEDPLRRYAVFRREAGTPDVARAEDLVGFVGASDTTWAEAFAAAPGVDVEYRVAAQSLLGFLSGGSNVVSTAQTSLSAGGAADRFVLRLDAPQPNPARAEAALRFVVPQAGEVELAVFDLLGRRVATPVAGWLPAGPHRAALATTGLADGVYLMVLRVGHEQQTQRLVVAR